MVNSWAWDCQWRATPTPAREAVHHGRTPCSSAATRASGFTKSQIRHNLKLLMDTEAIKRSFEGSGLRCTPQRYAVMAFLMEHNRHPTAADIFEAVNRVDPRSSRATTYNNLRDLVDAGLVREVDVEGRAAGFDAM